MEELQTMDVTLILNNLNLLAESSCGRWEFLTHSHSQDSTGGSHSSFSSSQMDVLVTVPWDPNGEGEHCIPLGPNEARRSSSCPLSLLPGNNPCFLIHSGSWEHSLSAPWPSDYFCSFSNSFARSLSLTLCLTVSYDTFFNILAKSQLNHVISSCLFITFSGIAGRWQSYSFHLEYWLDLPPSL